MPVKQHSKMKVGIRTLVFLALGLLIAGCSSIGVENTSKDQTARVTMYLPDRSGSTSFTLAPGQSGSELTVESGLVVILAMPNDDYIRELEEVKLYYEGILKLRGGTFTEADYREATKKVGEFNEKIKQASLGGSSCYVKVAENMDVVASLSWDEPNGAWKITCVTRKQETESSPSS